MPTLASHRKPRTSRTLQTLHAHHPAVGVTTAAALASVTFLSSQSATAASGGPGDQDRGPTVEEVQRKVDDLYRQAGTATQQYGKAREATDEQRREVGGTLAGAARRTEAPDESRRTLGSYAATRYGSGGPGPATSLVFSDAPQAFVDQAPPVDRLTGHRHETLTDRRHETLTDRRTQRAEAEVTEHWGEAGITEHRAEAGITEHRAEAEVTGQRAEAGAAEQRAEATRKRESLTVSQASLRSAKQTVQRKLGEARSLLARLTAEERGRQEEARRKAEEQRQQERQDHRHRNQQPDDDTGHTAKAREVLAFAEAQIGKPYVWGATGPSSYDCSGLTQAAWRAAGVDLPRAARDQVQAGTRVATEDLRPGDLVFFYDDIRHVGIYKGDGKMIHALGPGANVREESIHCMPVHSGVRPA